MNNVLRDQLLKAGLVTEEQAKAASTSPRSVPKGDKSRRNDSRGKRVETAHRPSAGGKSSGAGSAAIPGRKKRPRGTGPDVAAPSGSRNPAQTPSPYAHLDKTQREAVRKFLREHRRNQGDGDSHYHFQEGRAVRKLWVTKDQRDELARGALVIVPRNERYYVIDAALVETLLVLDSMAVVIRAEEQADGESGDPEYQDYPIPDDLVW